MPQLRNNYSFAPTSSYGLQLPEQYSSMGSWGSPDVPSPSLYNLAPTNADSGLGIKTGQINPLKVAVGTQNKSFLDGAFGPDGWGGLALNAAGGLASAFLGMKQYGLAKQTLAENRRQFQLNYDAQKQTTNTRLEDRQRARVASNANAYQSPSDYMAVNGIK